MELINLYIPNDCVEDEENLVCIVCYYEELGAEKFANPEINLKEQMIDKARELKEPKLVTYLKEHLY